MATKKAARPEKRRLWLSYDLGLRGNYEALYEWLDRHEAKECGDSVATFTSDESATAIKKELTDILGDLKKVRIYLIDKTQGGRYLIGGRKAAPWAGYFEAAVASVMDN